MRNAALHNITEPVFTSLCKHSYYLNYATIIMNYFDGNKCLNSKLHCELAHRKINSKTFNTCFLSHINAMVNCINLIAKKVIATYLSY